MDVSLFPFDTLLTWYKTNGRHQLWWRLLQTPYHVWISEIFLQQTQVSRVEDYFQKVINAFPTIYDFALLEYEDFFPYYQWLWYYSRAKNMLKTAKIIVEKYNGIFPKDYKELLALPGIWPYTAQAILAFWYDEKVLAFDTNIEKIFSRYYFWSRFIKLSSQQKQHLQWFFGETSYSGREINAALMDFSALMDKNELSQIDFKNYIFKDSIFYTTQWKKEIAPEKKQIKFDTSSAEIIVFLHENHISYYSSDYDTFAPFFLGISSQNHRHFIKDFFLTHYQIHVSVRPAFKKFSHKNKTYFFYHAQIQIGKVIFWEFKKSDYTFFLENFLNE